MTAQANADEGYLADLVIIRNLASANGRLNHFFNNLIGAGSILAADRKGKVGHALDGEVLQKHIYVDIGLGDRAENRISEHGGIRDRSQGKIVCITAVAECRQ